MRLRMAHGRTSSSSNQSNNKGKKRKKEEEEEFPPWNEMIHDILVDIVKRLPLFSRLSSSCLVCKSWLMATLDSLFPPCNVLDLRPLDDSWDLSRYEDHHRKLHCSFLPLMLRYRSTAHPLWSTLYLCNEDPPDVPREIITRIAQRSPMLESLTVPLWIYESCNSFRKAMPYWKNLRAVTCPGLLAHVLSWQCQHIEELCLLRSVSAPAASAISNNFPKLKRLSLRGCALARNALSVILDGHPDLDFLNTRHAFRVVPEESGRFYNFEDWTVIAWNEELINRKATGVKIHVQCRRNRGRNRCSKCPKLC